MPCRVNAITGMRKGESVQSKQGPGPLTVLQGAPVSSILHAGASLKAGLLDSAWAAWRGGAGPAGSPVSSHHTHEPCDANPSAARALRSPLHNPGLVYDDYTCGLQTSQFRFIHF